MIEPFTDPSTSIEFIGGVLTFALLGGLRTFVGSKNNEEAWEWAKGKYEIAIVTGAGALAGVFVLSVGEDISSVVFGAAVMTTGILLREVLDIGGSSYEHYHDLLDRGVPKTEAAFLGMQHGWENGNVEEVQEAIAALLETAGHLPSGELARERSRELGDAYRSGGLRGGYEDAMDEDDMIEIDDEFDPDDQPPESESNADSDSDPDEGPVVIDQGA